MNSPVSPLTATKKTALTDSFSSNDVVSLYKKQLGTDVSAFLPTEGTFHLFECTETGYRFYYPKGMDGDGVFYSYLQQQLGDQYYHKWKWENQLAYDLLKEGDKVLDIGCGVGNFLIRAKEKASEVCGLELNNEAVEVCRQRGINTYNEFLDKHAEKRTGYYDMVCMFQVLEHIYDVKGFLEDALKALKKGGILVIGVPNNEPYFLGHDKYCTLNLPPHHMGLWNKKVFEKMAPIFNLSIEHVTYDVKGSIATQAYIHAKYLLNIKSIGGNHTTLEKIKMVLMGVFTVPAAIYKKLTTGINGAHITVAFKKL